MNTRSARVRAGVVTGLAAATLTLAGCNDVSPGENGGEDQQQEQEQEGGDDD
jgi:hypothetical protein